ncbi:sensor domain-containing diguanylate cyclase [Vibrio sp. SM6]|uniref:Sensor domain-containing diguanylate cyclase n=1 Tax=Vibrio agarilyticus TaxID=2726741 RepID=A0A7X8TPU7_9VIBR|nr:sensor domain-containing diguanylate cyclase [Vibrio agarilyticus]NLS12663.1 sensor domain-containing diguanylate cyclase [Vibrio agarilyticus]
MALTKHRELFAVIRKFNGIAIAISAAVSSLAYWSYQTEQTALLFAGLVFVALLLILLPLAVFAALTNYRQLKREQRQREQMEHYSNIIDKHVPIMETNLSGKIVRCNAALCQLSGYQTSELIGEDAAMIRHPSAVVVSFREMWKSISHTNKWTGEFHNQTKSGDDFWLKADVIPVYRDDGKLNGFLSIASDISDKKRLEQHSLLDCLTGLANRTQLETVLSAAHYQASRYHHPFSILLIDIDYFKSVNDSFGHLAGDQVLKALGQLLRQSTRTSDCAGRWGGEEFMIVCQDTDLPSAVAFADRLLNVISHFHFPHVGELTVSIGVAQYQGEGPLLDVIQAADVHLYRAKSQGRNQISSMCSVSSLALNESLSTNTRQSKQSLPL